MFAGYKIAINDLLAAASEGDVGTIDCLQKALGSSVDAEAQKKALHAAVINDKVAAVEYFLNHYPYTPEYKEEMLNVAAYHNLIFVASFFVEHHKILSLQAMRNAIQQGHPKMVEWLYNHDLQYRKFFTSLSHEMNVDLRSNDGESLLHRLFTSWNPMYANRLRSEIQRLVAAGVDPDAENTNGHKARSLAQIIRPDQFDSSVAMGLQTIENNKHLTALVIAYTLVRDLNVPMPKSPALLIADYVGGYGKALDFVDVEKIRVGVPGTPHTIPLGVKLLNWTMAFPIDEIERIAFVSSSSSDAPAGAGGIPTNSGTDATESSIEQQQSIEPDQSLSAIEESIQNEGDVASSQASTVMEDGIDTSKGLLLTLFPWIEDMSEISRQKILLFFEQALRMLEINFYPEKVMNYQSLEEKHLKHYEQEEFVSISQGDAHISDKYELASLPGDSGHMFSDGILTDPLSNPCPFVAPYIFASAS